jgi:hypothetical protein
MMAIPCGIIKESFLSHGLAIPAVRVLSTTYHFIPSAELLDSVVLAKPIATDRLHADPDRRARNPGSRSWGGQKDWDSSRGSHARE